MIMDFKEEDLSESAYDDIFSPNYAVLIMV